MNKEYLKLIKVEFMHGVEEPWCNNKGVAILPYVLKDHEYHYLLSTEYNPLFKNKQISQYSTITGRLENNNHYQTVIQEMLEETGIDVINNKAKIHYLGKHYANKSSTKLWYFYGIDLSKLNLDLTKTYKGTGDNTIGEKEISARFVNKKQFNKSNDVLSLATYGKLNLKNLIGLDNNINQKLDMILQILNEQKIVLINRIKVHEKIRGGIIMKCNYCWRKASWSMKSIFYGNTFYKFICTYHFIKETLSLLEIKQKLKEKLGGKNNEVIK